MEWSPSFIVSEDALLGRCLLHKAWLAVYMGQATHFNETEITPEFARALLREAGLDPDKKRSGVTDSYSNPKATHEERVKADTEDTRSQIGRTNESTGVTV